MPAPPFRFTCRLVTLQVLNRLGGLFEYPQRPDTCKNTSLCGSGVVPVVSICYPYQPDMLFPPPSKRWREAVSGPYQAQRKHIRMSLIYD